jgi:siroheme synthase (precorrin-2 oxidase/ferrochelatase)
LRRGRLQVSVSTGGASPSLAREIRSELEGLFGPEWSGLIEELARARRNGDTPEDHVKREVRRCLSRLRG